MSIRSSGVAARQQRPLEGTTNGDPRWRRCASVAYVVGGGLTGVAVLAKSEALEDVLGLPRPASYAVLGGAVFLPAVAIRLLRRAGALALPLLLGLCAVCLVFQPMVQDQQDLERGTDQDDCITVGLERLGEGRWPYDAASMWSENPMSCGPGWIGLHGPAELWGYPATMAVVWLGTVATAAVVRGRRFAAELVVLVAGIPGVWLGFANGTDFATFALVLTALAVACESRHRAVRAAALVLSVPVSQFRFPFLTAPALFADTTRTRRPRPATLAVGCGLAVWAAFAAWDLGSLVHDGPLNVVRKASGGAGGALPAVLAFVVMVAVAVIAAASSARLRRPRRLFVYCTALLAPMVATSLVGQIISGGPQLSVLGTWEGTSWLTAIVVIAVFLLLSEVHDARGGDVLQHRSGAADDTGVHRSSVPIPPGPPSN